MNVLIMILKMQRGQCLIFEREKTQIKKFYVQQWRRSFTIIYIGRVQRSEDSDSGVGSIVGDICIRNHQRRRDGLK